MPFNQLLRIVKSQFPIINFGLVVSILGIANFSSTPLSAANFELTKSLEKNHLTASLNSTYWEYIPVSKQTKNANSILTIETVQLPPSDSVFASGTYLYGQSSQPEEIGQEYLVFELSQEQVIGALYFPQSEFACFYGNVDSRQMSLVVVDPYTQETADYAIALAQQSNVAGGNNAPSSIAPLGYERIATLSDNDWRILNTCLSDHQDQI